MSATSNLGLPYIDAGQAQKHVTHNEALRSLDTLVQLAVLDRDLSEPPESPAEGARWIVKAGASGAWSGHAGHVAAWQDGAWQFSVPVTGWVAYVADEEILVAWGGDSWNAVSAGEGGGDLSELQEVALLGIGTTADEINPLSARINNVLWAAKTVAEGGDGTLRYKMSKESEEKTLSLLFQDNFVGCAEIGLTGDDDFHFKVSPDGTNWLEAIRIDRANGKVAFPSTGVREALTANRTYYVRTDGSDSNTGLANTAGGAFLTPQKAWDAAVKLDLAGYSLTIQLGDGSYTGGLSMNIPPVGGNISVVGNTSTPGNVVLSKTGGNAIGLMCVAVVNLSGVKVSTSTSGNGIYCGVAGAQIKLGAGMQFGACANNHIYAENGGYVSCFSSYTINGAAQCHLQAQRTGGIDMFGQTVTLSGTPAFSTGFAYALALGRLIIGSITYSGGATGVRYFSGTNSVIDTSGGGASFFPGNAAGSAASGGLYL
ncbi:MAG TPA: DUF2793 domain-containing protein [Xanthobacteraceae bacterium]|nr:DUF2793 domain-containing protein [Xanthobacteraceae bacterium]